MQSYLDVPEAVRNSTSRVDFVIFINFPGNSLASATAKMALLQSLNALEARHLDCPESISLDWGRGGHPIVRGKC